jgi:hypothetical protein
LEPTSSSFIELGGNFGGRLGSAGLVVVGMDEGEVYLVLPSFRTGTRQLDEVVAGVVQDRPHVLQHRLDLCVNAVVGVAILLTASEVLLDEGNLGDGVVREEAVDVGFAGHGMHPCGW